MSMDIAEVDELFVFGIPFVGLDGAESASW
jgi:hypothetical protein